MENLIVGSGPSAAGAALALCADESQSVTVVDIGERLEDDARSAVARLAGQDAAGWSARDVETISEQPVRVGAGRIPQKRAYGSDFAFRDRGQQDGVLLPTGGNTAPVSGALGGFSNVWGAQAMPFSRSTFDSWPVSWTDIEPHYRAVLAEVPLAAEEDDYAEEFPLLGPSGPLPPVSARTGRVLDRYARHREAIRRAGVVVGKARIALASAPCVRCGLCMTGCPYGLIYSASHTFERLIRAGRIRYLSDMLVTRVRGGDRPAVTGVELATGSPFSLSADRVLVGAGAIGTSRIVLSSMDNPPAAVPLQESMQFLVPFVSATSTGDPRRNPGGDFTLNQFNMLVEFDHRAYTTSQIHCYPYNPAIAGALPAPLRAKVMDRAAGELLGRLTAGFGYLPSWEAPQLTLRLERGRGDRLAEVSVQVRTAEKPLLRKVLARLAQVAPRLDLYPVLPMVTPSGPAKSYHFGSTFPHGQGSDLLGRVDGLPGVHLIDGAVLPSVPSTTFTLTVMANAHRIASEALRA
ncbi:hypothetical protein [Georgenia alba]|uniref:4Fe-4S ferredoxin-type domain-containing protein n=1 Tax=Georgenia alba TaxID=2233858 RepID=A0ABW2Q646_9MICO